MKAAELFIKCLENEGVEYIFGIPGEETLALMDALLDSPIQFVTTRHEQGAAFMADVYGRVTWRAGVCMSTLGPGATNLITGVADANMDHAPLVAIAGQADTNRLHKESHQVLDLQHIFAPVTKYSSRVLTPNVVPEVIRKAFKLAQTEKTGACFIELPENLASMDIESAPLRAQQPTMPEPADDRVAAAAQLLSEARNPIILAGNGVIRAKAWRQLADFAAKLNIPVANTFMAKGAVPFKHPMALGSVGLQAHDYVNTGFDKADVILCVGYDLVEYHPRLWHPTCDRKIIHVDTAPAEVDTSYVVEVGVVGDIRHSLSQISERTTPQQGHPLRPLRDALIEDMNRHKDDMAFPMKPQKIIWDLRTAMDLEDIVVCDVGAHKLWMARMFRCEHPNTCIISNGFASMGIAVPGAVAARLAHPQRRVVAVTGDAGFMMNSQEIETAIRLNIPLVVLIWNDGAYGLIEWKQMSIYGRHAYVRFNNPDFVKYAESFGANGYRINHASELMPILQETLSNNRVNIIDCPVDYTENFKLTAKLGEAIFQL
jgi:acetolactate synthase I/II/III large subunit